MKRSSIQDWQTYAEKRLGPILEKTRKFRGLARLGPQKPWSVHLNLVGSRVMSRLNTSYRGKKHATDVLSFPAFDVFRKDGILGEIIICLPTLKSQAKILGHSIELELEILLTHGVLHLLGLDHEEGQQQAAEMAQWESKILKSTLSKTNAKKLSGLIERANSGIKVE